LQPEFWEVHDALYANQSSLNEPKPEPKTEPKPTPRYIDVLKGAKMRLALRASNEVAAAKAAEKQANDKPFVGVTWPDGAVTVRFAKGGSWSMSRSSREGVPSEVDVACTWSTF
jgi:hypothetical protein